MAKSNKFILGKCEYDPETRTISSEGQEPRIIGHVQAKLLQLLYQSPNQYFSNEELQQHVWDNRFIENTTIRTTVSYLRKSLDESSDCKYIDSGRNKGYRFVAKVEEISKKRQLRKFLPITTIGLLSVLLVYFVLHTEEPLIIPNVQTTLLGQELDATVNQDLLIFSHKPKEEKYWNLYAKRVGNEQYHRLTSGKFNDIKATFSKDGNRIVFNRHDGQSCKIIIADVNRVDNRLDNLQVAFNCPSELLSISIAWQDDQHLYLSYTQSLSRPYQIYSYNIETKESKAISSPPVTGSGDYFISKSTDSGKVIFFRNIVGARTEIWLYDEQTNRSSKKASFPLVLGAAAWVDSGNSLVVRTGNGQLSTLNLNDGDIKLLFKANYPIYYPYSVDGNSIGYMRGSLKVRDIVKVGMDGKIENMITSSFSDYRPVYAQNSEDIAFISNRSGTHQIWLQKHDGELIQLTDFDRSYKITDMAISRNGDLIAYSIDTNLHVISNDGSHRFSSNDKRIYKNPVFSNDGKKLYYSINNNEKWVLELISLQDWRKTKTDIEGFVVRPCPNRDCFYFTQFDDETLFLSEEDRIENTGITPGKIKSPNQLAIVENSIYYAVRYKKNPEVFQQNLDTRKITKLLTLPNAEFSFKEKPLQFISSISRESDTNLETIDIR